MDTLSKYEIQESNEEIVKLIDDNLVTFNKSCVPFSQKDAFIPINYHIKNNENIVIAGVNALLYCWGILYIDVLFVDKTYRHQNLGVELLNKVEKHAKELGASIAHLDTFDWQAKDFYLKQGYEIFGTLEDCPPSHRRYYLKKSLTIYK